MFNIQIDTAKLKNMETKLNCKFGNGAGGEISNRPGH